MPLIGTNETVRFYNCRVGDRGCIIIGITQIVELHSSQELFCSSEELFKKQGPSKDCLVTPDASFQPERLQNTDFLKQEALHTTFPRASHLGSTELNSRMHDSIDGGVWVHENSKIQLVSYQAPNFTVGYSIQNNVRVTYSLIFLLMHNYILGVSRY